MQIKGRHSQFMTLTANRVRAAALLLAIVLLAADESGAGDHTHEIRSPRQEGVTTVRVLTPDRIPPNGRLRTLYVLPVEAGVESRWGDPVAEVKRWDFANRYQLIVALPTFSALPWYADHPTDPEVQQESYLHRDVIPLVDRLYPTDTGPDGRLLVGFSKSGWGAWSLLLRHPDKFAKAAAWDAPLMQAAPDRFGMGSIFGTQANFERYHLSKLVRERAALLRGKIRLVLTGYYDSFRSHHVEMHGILEDLRIPHEYRDGPKRRHDWESGWLDEAVSLLVNGSPASGRR